MDRKGTGGHEHSSGHEKDAASKHLENSKNEANHFSPLESTTKLSQETKTKGTSPDIKKPEGASIVSSDSTNEEPFGNGWKQKQLEILNRSGYLQRRDQTSGATQRLENQRLEADAGDKIRSQNSRSPDEQKMIDRQISGQSRLFLDHERRLIRSRL